MVVSLKIALQSLVLLFVSMTGAQVMAYEEPAYEVVSQQNGYEIRLYQERLAAQVRSNGSQNGSFQLLFQYISGANTGSAKVDMTVPVIQSEKISMTVPVLQSEEAQTNVMQFFLPSKFTSETVPQPTNARVEIVTVEGGFYAVQNYRGSASSNNFSRARDALLTAMSRDGHKPIGEVIRATYNGPFTLPFLRRNEAMVRVEYPQ